MPMLHISKGGKRKHAKASWPWFHAKGNNNTLTVIELKYIIDGIANTKWKEKKLGKEKKRKKKAFMHNISA